MYCQEIYLGGYNLIPQYIARLLESIQIDEDIYRAGGGVTLYTFEKLRDVKVCYLYVICYKLF